MLSTFAKPGMFGLGMVPKESFLAQSNQFIFLIIRLVLGNVVMVAIDMCKKKPHHKGVDIWNYMKTCISFYVFRLLFICLFNNIFTFLYLQCLIYIS